tara:strand:- start:528 stop:932 length:405 start_codon:yes stop_codon:yes gene_type:complete
MTEQENQKTFKRCTIFAWLGLLANASSLWMAINGILGGLWLAQLAILPISIWGVIVSWSLVKRKEAALSQARKQILAYAIAPFLWANIVNGGAMLKALGRDPVSSLAVLIISIILYYYFWNFWGSEKAKEYANK